MQKEYGINFSPFFLFDSFYKTNSIGRFLKPDNIIPDVFKPQSWNLYSYVNGNPVNFNDPSGHIIGVGMPQIAWIESRSSFGMTWFDQFREGSAYLPWFGQNPENSFYWYVSSVGFPPARIDYGPAVTPPQDYAMLAAAEYDPSGAVLPEGWELCETKSSKSGLQAAVYHNTVTGEYVVVFAGVNAMNDVFSSLGQMSTGNSKQFEDAKDYVEEVMKRYICSPTLVGHSLGGGLAAAVAVQEGLHAITFNAEGVNVRSVHGKEVLAKARDLVINYFTAGDWLILLQGLTPLPNAAGRQVYAGEGGHGIKFFIIAP